MEDTTLTVARKKLGVFDYQADVKSEDFLEL